MLSAAFDEKVRDDSVAAAGSVSGGDYGKITSLSARQALGGFELVGSSTNPKFFFKDLSYGTYTGYVDSSGQELTSGPASGLVGLVNGDIEYVLSASSFHALYS